MEKYMNKPIEYTTTIYKDKKKVAKIFCITVKQVNDILKSKGM